MRRAALALLLCSTAPFYAGCITEDDVTPDGGTPPAGDGGTANPDATVVADGGRPANDAATAAEAEAGPAMVTLVMRTASGAPAADVAIVYADATGQLTGTDKTDATGRVTRLLPSGSQVTAILGKADEPRLLTITGVEPGDVLTAALPPTEEETSGSLEITSLPAGEPQGIANLVAIAGNCQNSAQALPLTLSVYEDCVKAGRFPLVVVASNGNGAFLGYTHQKGIQLVPDGGLPDSGVLSVAMNGSWVTTSTTADIQATHVTGDPDGRGTLTHVTGGVETWETQYFDAIDDAGVTNMTFQTYTGFADFLQREVAIRTSDNNNGVAYTALASRGGSNATLDVSQALPALTGATVDSTTPARPMVAWTSSSPITGADGAVVDLRWYFQADGGRYIYGDWTFVTAPGATSVKAPQLPETLSSWQPPDGAVFRSPPSVMVVEGSPWSSYGQLRASAAAIPVPRALLNDNSEGPIVPPLPIDGTVKLTAFTHNGD